MRQLYLILLLLLPVLAQAQSKVNASTAIWPEWQITSGIGGSEAHLLFLRNSYRINTNSDFNDLKESGVLSNFERVELSVGYENTLTDHWRAGFILRYAAENYPTTVFASPFLRHSGSIKSLYFNKQLTFDYVKQEDIDAFGRFRLMAELGKRLPVATRYLTPSISYEILLRSEFGKDENNAQSERTIDRSRLRLSLNFELTEKLRINPYFMWQTDYYYVQVPPVYNEQGQLLEESYETKRNRRAPVVGLELKYHFNRAVNTASITY